MVMCIMIIVITVIALALHVARQVRSTSVLSQSRIQASPRRSLALTCIVGTSPRYFARDSLELLVIIAMY